jgi:hypothetical protein
VVSTKATTLLIATEIQRALGHLAFGSQFARHQQDDGRGRRDADGSSDGRIQRLDVEPAQRTEHARKRQHAFRERHRGQPAVAQQPGEIYAAAEFEQHEAQADVEKDAGVAEHARVEHVQPARAQRQPDQNVTRDARQIQHAADEFAGQRAGQQHAAEQRQRIGRERKLRQELDFGQTHPPLVTACAACVPRAHAAMSEAQSEDAYCHL